MDDRPIVYAIVGKRLPNGMYAIAGRDRALTLEDAADYARFGWEVWPDPWGLEALTRWEQFQRSLRLRW